jgi:ABC-type transporter MlaC component
VGTTSALYGMVVRAISGSLIALLCTVSTAAKASDDRSRNEEAPPPQAMRAQVRTDPLTELARADRTIETLLHRRVPNWSPEADAVEWEVDSVLAGLFDYQQIARGSLGPDWDRLTADQRMAFLRALAGLTNRAFVAAIARPDVQLRFGSETILGPKASVLVTATAPGRTADAGQEIEYRLARKQGRWLIYDVLVGGVSFVDRYRDQFARLIQRDGAAGLIARMQRKLEVSGPY